MVRSHYGSQRLWSTMVRNVVDSKGSKKLSVQQHTVRMVAKHLRGTQLTMVYHVAVISELYVEKSPGLKTRGLEKHPASASMAMISLVNFGARLLSATGKSQSCCPWCIIVADQLLYVT